jgi:hypothetical protein
MSILGKEELSGACRTIYDAASGDYMLPPLIRDAGSDQTAKHTYYYFTKKQCLRFTVEFDKAFVDSHGFPLSRLPLLFKSELSDPEFRQPPIVLTNGENQALIRAFFLGVKSPVIAEIDPSNVGVRLSVQLSSTFFVECGELGDDDGDLSSVTICRSVSRLLYKKSAAFFEDAKIGLAIWNVRAAEELFGYTKSSAETYWPETFCAEIAAPDIDCSLSAPAHGPSVVDDAGPPVRAEFVVPLTTVPSAPLLAATPATIAGRLRAMGGIAAAAIVAALIFAGRPPHFQKTDGGSAYVAATPITVASDVSRATSTPPPSEIRVIVPQPPIPAPSSLTLNTPDIGVEVGSPPQRAPVREIHGAQRAKRSAEVQLQSTRRAKVAVHRARRRQSDPIVAFSRATEKFFVRVIKDLGKVPHQISTTIAGG